ncbi:membrane protein [Mycobacterium phage PenguinLover67]|nr:membrane protein [Mycobacterium phage PenguinLover67]
MTTEAKAVLVCLAIIAGIVLMAVGSHLQGAW